MNLFTASKDQKNELEGKKDSSQNNKTLLRLQLVKGAHSGNLLHDILEHSNFKKSSDDESNLQESIKWPLVKYGDLPDGFCEADLESWLNQVVNTPLFSNKHQVDFRLCDIAIHKRDIRVYVRKVYAYR